MDALKCSELRLGRRGAQGTGNPRGGNSSLSLPHDSLLVLRAGPFEPCSQGAEWVSQKNPLVLIEAVLVVLSGDSAPAGWGFRRARLAEG